MTRWGNKGLFNKWCHNNRTSTWKQKETPQNLLASYIKRNWKWIIYLHVKTRAVRLLEDKRDFLGNETTLCSTPTVGTCLYACAKPVACTILTANPDAASYRLWVVRMCWGRPISCNKCTTRRGMLTVGEAVHESCRRDMRNLCKCHSILL